MGDAAVITFNEGRVASLSSRLARSLLSLTSALSSKPINASKASNGSVVHGPRQVGEISFTICGFEVISKREAEFGIFCPSFFLCVLTFNFLSGKQLFKEHHSRHD
jgi:hypothetical protein